MRRYACFVLSLLMLFMSSSAMASALPDLTEYNEDELRELREEIGVELSTREQKAGSNPSWDTSTAHLELTNMEIGYGSIILLFDYTNTTNEITNFAASNRVALFIDGVEQEYDIYYPWEGISYKEIWDNDVLPGRTFHGMSFAFRFLTEPVKTVDIAIKDYALNPPAYTEFQTIEIPDN